MKDIFTLTGMNAKGKADGTLDLTITLKTQVDTIASVQLLEEIGRLIEQQVHADITPVQSRIPEA